MSSAAAIATTFALSFTSGFVPVINVEAYLLSLAVLRPASFLVPGFIGRLLRFSAVLLLSRQIERIPWS